MGHFDRPARKAPELPQRLQQLNRELLIEKTKDHDYLYAMRQGIRIRVCVIRNEDGKFAATADIGKRCFRAESFAPVGAFVFLTVKVKTAIAEMTERDRDELRRLSALTNGTFKGVKYITPSA